MRRLDPEEVARREAAGRERAERLLLQRVQRPTSPELEQAMERARAALELVVHDVESTTNVREPSEITRYDDWLVQRALDPSAWLVDIEDDLGPEDDLSLACRFGGHTFMVHGGQSVSELAADIAFQIQDDVTEEIWGAWPRCAGHAHPMSPMVAERVGVWTCPMDSGVSVRIGQLGSGAGSSPSGAPSSPSG